MIVQYISKSNCFLEIKLAEKVGLDSEAHARAKGYEFKNYPRIDPFLIIQLYEGSYN